MLLWFNLYVYVTCFVAINCLYSKILFVHQRLFVDWWIVDVIDFVAGNHSTIFLPIHAMHWRLWCSGEGTAVLCWCEWMLEAAEWTRWWWRAFCSVCTRLLTTLSTSTDWRIFLGRWLPTQTRRLTVRGHHRQGYSRYPGTISATFWLQLLVSLFSQFVYVWILGGFSEGFWLCFYVRAVVCLAADFGQVVSVLLSLVF